MKRLLLALPVAALLTAAGPGGLTSLDPPAGPGSMAPNLVSTGKDILLTWLEPEGDGHRLRFSRLSEGKWSPPATVASGSNFFANWADLPGAAQAPDGSLVAHWLAKTGDDTYAYGIFLARSTDGGATWKPAGLLHDDRVAAEHGFVSWIPDGKTLRAVWLDGRETAKGGAMTLRSAVFGGGEDRKPRSAELLDDRVCDCCQTDAAVAADGPVVAYRDRTADEVRDIHVKRRTAKGWSPPVRVGADGWKLPGCPVNGPAIAAAGRRVAVAWFTGAPPGPRVQVAFSGDGGATFGKPVLVDGDKPLGRLDLALDAGGNALVTWLALEAKEGAALRLRRISPAGKAEPATTLARTSASRSGGVPRLVAASGRLYVAWVDDSAAGRRVRVGAVN
ncbi:MAG: sialidase family protein [Acidobacteriota bacterium]